MNAALKSWAKVFLATIFGLFLADGGDLFGIGIDEARTWLAAGTASVLPLIITWLDPNDTRFGRTR
jgi:hypothetical protein